MRPHDTFVVEPESSVALRQWAEERSDTLRRLAVARARQAELTAQLTSGPAARALGELGAAGVALVGLRSATTTARQRHDDAGLAAHRFDATDVTDARARLVDATRAVSDMLAGLLREASTSTMLTATVDGLALRERHHRARATDPPSWDHTTIPFPATPVNVIDPELALPLVDPAEGSEHRRLVAVLDRLDDRVDAVADLVTAESVHQMVQGNPTRAGASLAVASDGVVPDEFDVVTTPRPGHDVVHRLLVVIDPQRPAAWAAAQPGVAARADPVLASWASGLLPDPADVTVRVHRIDAGTGQPVDELELPMSALDLDPLSWVRAAASPPELGWRIDRAARARWAAIGPGEVVVEEIDTAGPGPRLSDLVAASDALGRLLARVRAMEPEDLSHPAATDTPDVPPAAVEAIVQRVRDAEQAVAALATALEDAAAGADPDALVDRLLVAAALGVAEAVPPTDSAVPDLELLRTVATAATGRLRERLTDPLPDPDAGAVTWARARNRAERLCGLRLPLLASLPVTLHPTARADLGTSEPRLAGVAAQAVRAWVSDHARVRAGVRAFAAAYDLAEVLGAAAALDLRVTQLPVTDPDAWAVTADAARAGAVAVAVQRGYDGPLPATVAGLVVETWNQPVAAPTYGTGLAVHYDRPDAAPPQAVVVAVHPDPGAGGPVPTWDLDTLLDVLTSTLALARDRATAAERCTVSGLTLRDPS